VPPVAWAADAGGAWLWLLWPAASLALVAAIYRYLDAESFAEHADGSMPFAVRCLSRTGLSG
jgi:hypothetical protein